MSHQKTNFFATVGGKLLLIFFVLGISIIVSLTAIAIILSSQALKKNAFNQLTAVRAIKQKQIESYFEEREGDVIVIADSNDVRTVANLLLRYQAEMGLGANDSFTRTDEQEGLSMSYSMIYKQTHDVLAKYCDVYGYYDIFLIDNKFGHVMYTWAKEGDLGTNLGTGEYKNSHLADVWRNTRNSDKVYVSDMLAYAPSNGAPAMFVGKSIKNSEGTITAVLAIQIPLGAINTIMQERTGLGKSGETYLVGPDKLMRSDSYLDPVNHSVEASLKNPSKGSVDTEGAREAIKGATDTKIIIDYNENPVLSSFAPVQIGNFTWGILAEIDEAEINKPINQLILMVLGLAVVIIVILVFVAVLFSQSLSKPIQEITKGLNQFADGNFVFDVDQKILQRKDEIGDSGRAMDSLVNNFTNLIVEVKSTSSGIYTGSTQVSSSAQSLSQTSSELASSIEEMSSSTEEMESTIDQNADNATEAEKIASKAASDAKKGGEAVNQTVESMKKIAQTIQVISEIANNTNMLALNAAIEAARAGEHGEGFAVVATEVRKLAERSLKAADEIKTLANSSVEVSERAGSLINDIVPSIIKTADMVQEISSASKEQKQGMKQLSKASAQQEKATQVVSSSSEELAASAEEMNTQAQGLIALVEKFQVKENSNGMLENSRSSKNEHNGHKSRLRLTGSAGNTNDTNYSIHAVSQNLAEGSPGSGNSNAGASDDFIQL